MSNARASCMCGRGRAHRTVRPAATVPAGTCQGDTARHRTSRREALPPSGYARFCPLLTEWSGGSTNGPMKDDRMIVPAQPATIRETPPSLNATVNSSASKCARQRSGTAVPPKDNGMPTKIPDHSPGLLRIVGSEDNGDTRRPERSGPLPRPRFEVGQKHVHSRFLIGSGVVHGGRSGTHPHRGHSG